MSDDLESIPNLQEKKKQWTQCAEEASKVEKKMELESGLIQHGRVKSQMTKFVEGEINDQNEDDVDDAAVEEDYKNANVVRPTLKKRDEHIKLDIDAKSIKSKFESGAVDNVSPVPRDHERRLEELEFIKTGGAPVRDRYKGQQEQSPIDEARRRSVLEDITPATAESIQQAKERFTKGETAFQESGSLHEKPKDVISYELGSVKEKFENPSCRKEDKFSAEDAASKIPMSARCAELESLKASFESGGKKKYTEEELEARRRRHLEKEFKRLQIEKGIYEEKQRREAEQEAGSQKTEGEIEEEIKRCAELSTLKQRFEQGLVGSENVAALKTQVESEGMINPEAKSIKAKFESNAFAADPKTHQANEEKRRHIQAEFEHFKEESQMMGKEEAEEAAPENVDLRDPELAQAREHAQKMRAKWDKMQRKEAKRAQKAANAKMQRTSQAELRYQTSAEICWACDQKVYIAESVDCDNRLYHKTCFKCKQCGCSLRLETSASGPDGIYCQVHYKSLFNDMSLKIQKREQSTLPSVHQNNAVKMPTSQDEIVTNDLVECIIDDFAEDCNELSDAEQETQLMQETLFS